MILVGLWGFLARLSQLPVEPHHSTCTHTHPLPIPSLFMTLVFPFHWRRKEKVNITQKEKKRIEINPPFCFKHCSCIYNYRVKVTMEVTMEAEDDLFFADLSKQISLLIMDDDDEDPVARCPSVSLQAFSSANYAATPSPLIFQEQTYRRESKGTGVFIPQSSHPRRKHNRQGRFTSLNSSKSQKQQQLDNTRFVSQAPYNNNNNKNSFHCKKG